jgi:hypothetical protein
MMRGEAEFYGAAAESATKWASSGFSGRPFDFMKKVFGNTRSTSRLRYVLSLGLALCALSQQWVWSQALAAPQKAMTPTTQLAELARQAKPRLLVLYHTSIAWRPVVDSERSRPEELLSEMMTRYLGHVVVGRDLDVY